MTFFKICSLAFIILKEYKPEKLTEFANEPASFFCYGCMLEVHVFFKKLSKAKNRIYCKGKF